MRALRTLERNIREDEARLANIPALLLVGEAGTGKKHLFCDIAQHRQKHRVDKRSETTTSDPYYINNRRVSLDETLRLLHRRNGKLHRTIEISC